MDDVGVDIGLIPNGFSGEDSQFIGRQINLFVAEPLHKGIWFDGVFDQV